jgi:hypothetical protein
MGETPSSWLVCAERARGEETVFERGNSEGRRRTVCRKTFLLEIFVHLGHSAPTTLRYDAATFAFLLRWTNGFWAPTTRGVNHFLHAGRSK